MSKNTILYQFNEINFDLIQRYIEAGVSLPGFQQLLSNGFIETSSEDEYRLLEPWIQWVSVYTGKTYEEHQVFRLGDCVNHDHKQIFEVIEERGYLVGCLIPMNATNTLKNPCYFVPDPWTKTPTDKSIWSKWLSDSISQAVNDNSQGKVNLSSFIKLGISCLRILQIKSIFKLTLRLPWAIKKPWRKAIFLDMLLFELSKSLNKRFSPNFSSLFLNSAAHIQHHYMLSSKILSVDEGNTNPTWYIGKSEDPLLEVIKYLDEVCLDILKEKEFTYLISTGLSQEPYKNPSHYYRLQNHQDFLKLCEIDFLNVEPRMTRDFEIKFSNHEDQENAYKKLEGMTLKGERLFGEIEYRNLSLFVSMDINSKIEPGEMIDNSKINIGDNCVFVAIKNGTHVTKGYAFFDPRIKDVKPPVNNSHVSMIYDYLDKLYKKN